MKTSTQRALALTVIASALLAGSTARAQTSRALVAFGPVTDARPALLRQLREALCAAVECVPWGTVSSRHGFDLARARSADLDGILVGVVKKLDGPRTAVVLSLFERKPTPAARWHLPVRRDGSLAESELARVAHALEARFASRPRPSPPPPRRAPPEPPPPARAPTVAPAPPPRAPAGPGGLVVAEAMILSAKPDEPAPPSIETTRPSPIVEQAPAPARLDQTPRASPEIARPVFASEPATPPEREREELRPNAGPRPLPRPERGVDRAAGRSLTPLTAPPWLAIELGLAAGQRELSFQGAEPTPGPLRGHRVPLLVAPAGRLELQPGAWFTDGALAGLSIQGSYAQVVGLETDILGVAHPTRMSWLSAGLAWRSAPPGRRRSWSVGASWELREVTVTPTVIGLPDRRLSGAKLALGVAQPLGRVTLSLAAGYVHWLEAPDLVAGRTPFFPGGSAFGLEAEAGICLWLGGPWSLRLGAAYSSTRYQLEADPKGFYAARSAVDGELGGRLALRFER